MRVLRMYPQSELAKLWKVEQSTVSKKLSHNTVSVREFQLVMRAHPEHESILLEALKIKN